MRTRQPEQISKEARIATVPKTQLCDICADKPAPERHFITVPLPQGFTRICDEDLAIIKKEIRGRVKGIVQTVLVDAMRRHRNI